MYPLLWIAQKSKKGIGAQEPEQYADYHRKVHDEEGLIRIRPQKLGNARIIDPKRRPEQRYQQAVHKRQQR